MAENETVSIPDPSEFVFRQIPAKVDAADDGEAGRAVACFQDALSGLCISELTRWKNSRAKRASGLPESKRRLEARDDEQTFADVGVQHDGRRIHQIRRGVRDRMVTGG